MELINGRYKVLKNIKKDHYSGQFVAIDLLRQNRKLILYLILDTFATRPFIEYCNNNFYKISSYKQENIICVYNYGIVETIDDREITENVFFYTTEYADTINLTDIDKPLKAYEILDVYKQLSRALDFLHYHGITYKYIVADTIKIINQNGKFIIKLLDIVSVYKMETAKTHFHNLTHGCISPEVSRGIEVGSYADIYSLGSLIYYLLTLKPLNHNDLNMSIKEYKSTNDKYGNLKFQLLNLVQKMTNLDIANRYKTVHQCNQVVKEIYNLDEVIENIQDMDRINFKIPLIGRDRELKQICDICQVTDGKIMKFNKDLILVSGDKSIGKSRLLREVNNLMKWNGYKTFPILTNEEGFSITIKNILRQLIKIASETSITKYGNELAKLMPEIAVNRDIVLSKTLPKEQEKLRFYDRIANFILDVSLSYSTVLLIDDFHLADKEALEFIDYLININKIKKAPLLLILAYRDEQYTCIENKEYINKWILNNTLSMKLSRLTIEETTHMMKHILGWNEDLLNYASKIKEDTQGIPGYIEYIIKELYSQKIIVIDYSKEHNRFVPKLNIKDYDKVILPDSVDESIIRQIKLLDSLSRDILYITSLFKTAVSKDIINNLLQVEEGICDNCFLNLIELNIICEKFDDWGYTYDFCNTSFKKYIYNNIEEKKRTLLHIKASNILEELYIKEGRENKDELIYHLIQSNQKNKAIDYCIQSGINMLRFFMYEQSYNFFKRAYELLDDDRDSRKLIVVFYIAKVSKNLFKNNDAIHYFNYAIKLAYLQGSNTKLIDAKNKIALIYLITGEIELAETYLNKSIDIAMKTNYTEGLMEAAYLLTKVYMQTRRFKEMKLTVEKYFNYACEKDDLYYIGIFMGQKGIVEYFQGKPIIALQFFKESVDYLKKTDRSEKAFEPINNIGIIYNKHFQDTYNARRYFQKALSISEQHHKTDHIITSTNNIAESYIMDYNFNKAINMLKKKLKMAYDYGDEILNLSIYTNLIKAYTNIGEYKQAYSYMIRGKDILKNNKFNYKGINVETYIEACVNLYMAMGVYNKALSTIEEFFEKFTDVGPLTKLRMRKLHYFAKYYNGHMIKHKELTELIEDYRETSYILDRRELLLDVAGHYIEQSKMKEVENLLEEDSYLINSINNNCFTLRRKYIGSFLLNEKEQIIILKNLILNEDLEKFKEVKWKILAQFGILQLKEKEYFKAINNFLDALTTIYTLFNEIPIQFRKLYLLKNDKFLVRANLLNMEDLINEDGINRITFMDSLKENNKEFLDEKDPKRFFSLLESENILKNKGFWELALKDYDKVNKTKITDAEGLMRSLTSDNITNLNLLLQLACRTTLATSGLIIIENSGEYEAITRAGQIMSSDEFHNILDSISNIREDTITKNSLDPIRTLSQDIRASIILPIYKEYANNESILIEKNKRSNHNITINKIIGYLYLKTNKILNNFSDETLSICKNLMPLASVFITSYNLTIFSSIDKLTGTYVRKYFEQVFNEEIQNADTNKHCLSIIMSDIDHFKNVNDIYGHQTGDTVLAQVGKVIKESVRSTDYVGRYGGEEFIVLLINADKKDAYEVAEKIRKRIERSSLIGKDSVLTISCGISTFPQDGNRQMDIIEKADQALYMAKENGRNQSVQWKKGIDFKNKRVDKLAGIVTGNIVQDQRNVLVIAEIIELISNSKGLEDNIYAILGRLTEILEAEASMLLTVEDGKISNEYYRRRFVDGWAQAFEFNKELIKDVIKTKQGKYIIDWEHINNFDPLTNTPNWESKIIIPIIVNDRVYGVIYLSVPIKEKEFDYNAYNLVEITSNVIGAILKINK